MTNVFRSSDPKRRSCRKGKLCREIIQRIFSWELNVFFTSMTNFCPARFMCVRGARASRGDAGGPTKDDETPQQSEDPYEDRHPGRSLCCDCHRSNCDGRVR